jgi:hypothetical protein
MHRGTATHPTRRPRKAGQTAEWHRDRAYDAGRHGNGDEDSAYSPRGVVPMNRRHGRCEGCTRLRDLFNSYCDDCRALGRNERQVMNLG